MSSVYIKIFEYVVKLSEEINELYEIDPVVNIKIDKSANTIMGECTTSYKRPLMCIDLILPANITLGRKNKATIDLVLIHEYCHYIEAFKLSARDKENLGRDYEDFISVKKQDEKKTWRQTKSLAQKLGRWNKVFFRSMSTYTYSSDISY